ncbi:Flagellar motor protein [Hahella chejuensis KCTC 2396]|uniref:Flagellar motor protein n=1 Tax=Hahella chejuensis (strain KCTC 2396) TaxID=349521 RepID=Q2SA12_HAHCH|nr:flagellar motor protein MotB [Hahella chejuensis]ABC32512.1 Flagellar motor protein [Hahella chejuensis KCTC 2396]
MSDEEEQKCECPPGLPAWMATFADLMSLLMCFFVLLLSFSEMDALKFKRLAGSMREAFGVQAIVNVDSIPKGTSIIAQEFSPGKPDPTPLQTIMQQTEMDLPNLEQLCEQQVADALQEECPKVQGEELSDIVLEKIKMLVEETENDAITLASALESEVRNNQVEVETRGRKIVIRVQEKGSFSSGSADLNPEFYPVIDKLVELLKSMEGSISVEGHSDSIPIRTARFRSNWDLSAARALEVAHALFESGELEPSRFSIAGYADTKPLAPNDSAENRARNRRVEIILQQPLDDETKKEIQKARDVAPGILPSDQSEEWQGLAPDEIF